MSLLPPFCEIGRPFVYNIQKSFSKSKNRGPATVTAPPKSQWLHYINMRQFSKVTHKAIFLVFLTPYQGIF